MLEKHAHFTDSAHITDLELLRTHSIPNTQIPIKWKYSLEYHIILSLWVFEEI